MKPLGRMECSNVVGPAVTKPSILLLHSAAAVHFCALLLLFLVATHSRLAPPS
jgi:hypothetical protein